MEPSSETPRPRSEATVREHDAALQEDQQALHNNGDAVIDTTYLARFEFSDAGTKILMVEWLPDSSSDGQSDSQPSVQGTAASESDATGWEVSWPGKSTFLRARDAEVDVSAPGDEGTAALRRRVFFLLPPDAPVPAAINLTPPGKTPIELKPLPAIFPEGFLDSESGQGTRGVLHTIWAKKRLRELDREMEAEMKTNAESVGLDMVLAEKQWIIDNFLRPPPAPPVAAAVSSMSAMTPRTPTGGRLGEKLKGLRLGTSPADLAPSPTANTFTLAGSQSHTLSPHGGDVAVSSFSSISRPLAGGTSSGAPMSLDAALKGEVGRPQTEEDDLFALPMSPRSPDMKKSPFSAL